MNNRWSNYNTNAEYVTIECHQSCNRVCELQKSRHYCLKQTQACMHACIESMTLETQESESKHHTIVLKSTTVMVLVIMTALACS